MAPRMKKALGVCYKPFPHIARDTTHAYLDPAHIPDNSLAVWTIQCILRLISLVIPCLAAAGEGHKLTSAQLTQITVELNEYIIVGGKKKKSTVQKKINDLLAVYQTVDFLENRVSGIKYDRDHGCNILTPEEDTTWQSICLQYPNATPFRNCGWAIYDDVEKLCPQKAKGTHSVRSSNGSQGTCAMREETPVGLHLFGELPIEIARIIFEIAALLSPRTAAELCLVSKTVFRWVERALYHTVILRHEPSIMAFARAIKYRNDPLFFATNVKTICFMNMLSGLVLQKETDALSLISSTCTGVQRLGYGLTPHLESVVFADARAQFPRLTHLSMVNFSTHFYSFYLPPHITHLHLDDEYRTVMHEDWAALFRLCTRLTHLFLTGRALNEGFNHCNDNGTQWACGMDLLQLLRPVISCLPDTLTTLVISVVPVSYLIAMLPPARSLVKRILDSDDRILMISPSSEFHGLIDGLYCCEGNDVSEYGPQWEHSGQGDDMWEFAERCIASRKRTQGGV